MQLLKKHSRMLHCMLLSCMNIVCYFWHWYQHSLLMWLSLFYCTFHLFLLCISHIPLRLLQRSIWAWVMLLYLILTVLTVRMASVSAHHPYMPWFEHCLPCSRPCHAIHNYNRSSVPSLRRNTMMPHYQDYTCFPLHSMRLICHPWTPV